MISWHIPEGLDVELLLEMEEPRLVLTSDSSEADYLSSCDIPALAFPKVTDTLSPDVIRELCATLPIRNPGDVYIHVQTSLAESYYDLQFRDHIAIHLFEADLARVYLLSDTPESPGEVCANRGVMGFYQYLDRYSALDEHIVCSLRLNDVFLRIKGAFEAVQISTGKKYNRRTFRAACVGLIPPYVYRPGMVIYHWWISPWGRPCTGAGVFPGKSWPLFLNEGKAYINRWRPAKTPPSITKVDITPFRKLLLSVFNEDRDGIVEFFLDSLAYKLQTPSSRLPYAFIFLGQQGTGKSLVCNILVEAFAPYSAYYNDERMNVSQTFLKGKYLVIFDEFPCNSLIKYVHNTRRILTERWLRGPPQRGYGNVALWLFTSNDARVADIVKDERRFVAVRSEQSLDPEIYREVTAWLADQGARQLAKYLEERDVSAFIVPSFPPMTSETAFNKAHSMDMVSQLAHQIKTSQENPLCIWVKDLFNILKLELCSPSLKRRNTSKQILLNLTTVKLRPILTVRELDIVLRNYLLVRYRKRWGEITVGELVHKLRVKGMRNLVNPDDVLGFEWQGVKKHYLIIHDQAVPDHIMTQAQFEELMLSGQTAFEGEDIKELIRQNGKL